MSKEREALKLALDAWEAGDGIRLGQILRSALTEQPAQQCKYPNCDYPCPDLPDCRDAEQPAIKQDLTPEQPAQQQEPVAWVLVDGELSYPDEIDWETLQEQGHEVELLYTSPPASKPWVGLSTSDLDEIDAPIRERGSATIAEIYRAIEAKLREKNA